MDLQRAIVRAQGTGCDAKVRDSWIQLQNILERSSHLTIYRRTFELSLAMRNLASSTVGNGKQPVQSVTENDLQCIELFDFFNYPRLPPAMTNERNPYETTTATTSTPMDTGAQGKEHFMIPNFGVAGAEPDWSGYHHASTGDSQQM